MFRALLQFSAVFGFVLVTGIPGAAWSGPRYVDRAVELHDRCSLTVVGDPGALGLDWSASFEPPGFGPSFTHGTQQAAH